MIASTGSMNANPSELILTFTPSNATAMPRSPVAAADARIIEPTRWRVCVPRRRIDKRIDGIHSALHHKWIEPATTCFLATSGDRLARSSPRRAPAQPGCPAGSRARADLGRRARVSSMDASWASTDGDTLHAARGSTAGPRPPRPDRRTRKSDQPYGKKRQGRAIGARVWQAGARRSGRHRPLRAHGGRGLRRRNRRQPRDGSRGARLGVHEVLTYDGDRRIRSQRASGEARASGCCPRTSASHPGSGATRPGRRAQSLDRSRAGRAPTAAKWPAARRPASTSNSAASTRLMETATVFRVSRSAQWLARHRPAMSCSRDPSSRIGRRCDSTTPPPIVGLAHHRLRPDPTRSPRNPAQLEARRFTSRVSASRSAIKGVALAAQRSPESSSAISVRQRRPWAIVDPGRSGRTYRSVFTTSGFEHWGVSPTEESRPAQGLGHGAA